MGKREKFKSMNLAKKTETLQMLPVRPRGQWLQLSIRALQNHLRVSQSQALRGSRGRGHVFVAAMKWLVASIAL